MRKYFVLSTRTTVSKRNVTLSFGSDNVIVIPMAVVGKVQSIYSTQFDERGKIAGDFLDYLSSFDRKKLFCEGVIQENGSVLKVATGYKNEKIPEKAKEVNLTEVQTRMLQTCLGIKKELKEDEKVVLVSKNTALRMIAGLIGIEAQTFKDELLPKIPEQYKGRAEIIVNSDIIDRYYKNGKISVEEVKKFNEQLEFYPNMFIVMKAHGTQSAIGRVEKDSIVPLVYGDKMFPYSVIPKNIGQRFMIEALMMDENIAPLVIIKGPAGTAKTFLSLAVGLELVVERGLFKNKILISRSPTETGEKIGFLPGGEISKIGPYLRGIMDNLKALHSSPKDEEKKDDQKTRKNSSKQKEDENEKPEYEDGTTLFEQKYIKAEAIGFIRGRSICDTYIIIDEAQNLTPTEAKTIITRVGTGTKLVLIGDPAQIDRPELSERNNGLSYASEHLKGEPTCWQITMEDDESVRSELAKRASMLL